MATRGLSSLSVSTGLDEIASIDWQAPWLKDWTAWGQPIAADALAHAYGSEHPVADALNRARQMHCPDLPIEFVVQGSLPHGMAYEAFIRQRGAVPTRDNAHDFFNGLAWLHTPRLKSQLNALQAAEIASMGVGSTRGPVRDAITVLDENGAFLSAPAPVWQALRSRDWQALFLKLRPLWNECRLWPFGHALQEKLIHPRKSMVAHVLTLEFEPVADWLSLDAMLSDRIEAAHLTTKPFFPIPVLGIPGWCADNEATDYYADDSVFRPARTDRD